MSGSLPPIRKDFIGLLQDILERLGLVERRLARSGSNSGGGSIVPGVILPYAGTSAPAGWLICDGTAKSRAAYPALFALIGTTYGAGDGSTTFNLPNLKGRVPVGRDVAQSEFDVQGEAGGAKTHTLTTAEMPAHTHGTGNAGSFVNYNMGGAASGNTGGSILNIQSNTGSAGGDGAHNNLQPYLVLTYIIYGGSVVIVPDPPAYDVEVLADTPLVWWRFREVSGTIAADSSGNSYLGTYTGSPTLAVDGPVDKAITLNGTSQWVAGNSNIGLNSDATWTVEFWYKSATDTGTTMSVLSQMTTNGSSGWEFRLTGDTTATIWRVSSNSSAATASYLGDQWHHWVATWNGSTGKIYRDGVELTVTPTTTSGSAGLSPLYVGRREVASPSYYTKGSIAEVAIYDYTLSAARILAHAQAADIPSTYEAAVLADSPTWYFPLNEATYPVVDQMGYATGANATGALAFGAAGIGDRSTSLDFQGGLVYVGTGPHGFTDFTVECIVKPDTITTMNLMTQYNGASSNAYIFAIVSGKIYLHIFSTVGSNTIVQIAGATTLSAGTSYHLAMTWEWTPGSPNTAFIRGYVNGVQDAYSSVATSASMGTGGGVRQHALAGDQITSYPLDGKMAGAAFYTSALSGARILAHAQAAGLA